MKNAPTTFSINFSLVHAAERDHFNLEDFSKNALLTSSGCYRLHLVRSADSIAVANLRVAIRTLGFKPKDMTALFSHIVPILLLSNLQFADGDSHNVSAYVSKPHVLDQAARLLGVSLEDLDQIFTNKTSYVRNWLFIVLLNAEESGRQRDQCERDLYALLLSRLQTTVYGAPSTQIILFNQPGFQTGAPGGTFPTTAGFWM